MNKTDLRLIAELQADGSASYADLAAKLNITPKTVAVRIGRLIKSKVITVRAQPNPYKLGLFANAVIAIKVDRSKIKDICEHLSGHFFVNLVQTVFGRFDIMISVYFPSWELLHQFIHEELYAIAGIKKVEFYIVRDVLKRYDQFFQKEPFSNGHTKLTDTDWILIWELAKNGRANTVKLAEKMGVHVTTLYKRINALCKSEIIKIIAVPTPSRSDVSSSAYIMLDAEPLELNNICNSLYPLPEVHFIMTLNYRSGAVVCIHAKNTETLYEFITEQISPLKGLIDCETIIRAMVQKTYYWSMKPDEPEKTGTPLSPAKI